VRILRDNRALFFHRMGNQHAVEGIPMMVRQTPKALCLEKTERPRNKTSLIDRFDQSSGTSSRPMALLMAISHAETALTRTSFLGSSTARRAAFESRALPSSAQIWAWVSSINLTRRVPTRRDLSNVQWPDEHGDRVEVVQVGRAFGTTLADRMNDRFLRACRREGSTSRFG